MKYLAITCLFVLFLTQNLFSQKIAYPKQQAGIGYSSYSGAGVAYQVEISNRSAFKFSGIGYYFGEQPPDDLDFYGIIGGEYQRTILKSEDTRYYALAAVSMLHLERRRISIERINDVEIIRKTIETDRIYNFGLGLGLEYKPHPVIALSFDAGLLYQISDNASFGELWDRNPSGTSYFGIGIGIGIRYVF